MANIYVNSGATGADDGSSHEDAETTINNGVTTASQGDTIFISDTTDYNESLELFGTTDLYKFSSTSGFTKIVGGGADELLHTTKAQEFDGIWLVANGITAPYVVNLDGTAAFIFLNGIISDRDGDASSGLVRYKTGSSDIAHVMTNSIVIGGTSTSLPTLRFENTTAGSATYNDCFIDNRYNYIRVQECNSMTFNRGWVSSIQRVLATESTFDGAIVFDGVNIMPSGVGSAGGSSFATIEHNASSAGTVTVQNSLLYVNPLDATQDIFENVTLGNGNTYASYNTAPLFKSPRRTGSISLMLDDDINVSAGDFFEFYSDAGRHGLKVGVTTGTQVLTAGDWTTLQTAVAAGHEVVSHGASGTSLTDTKLFDIVYAGAGSATIEVTSTNLITRIDTVIDKNYVLASNTAGQIRSDLDSDSNYTLTNFLAGGSGPATIISTMVETSISSVVAVNVTESAYQAYEVQQSRDDIIENLGVPATAFVYSNAHTNLNARTALRDAGYRGARVSTSGEYDLEIGYNPYLSLAIEIGTFPQTAQGFCRQFRSLMEWVNFTGAHVNVYGHRYLNSEVPQERYLWGLAFKMLRDGNTNVQTLTDQYNQIRKQADTISGDEFTVTTSFATSDDAWYSSKAYKTRGRSHVSGNGPLSSVISNVINRR